MLRNILTNLRLRQIRSETTVFYVTNVLKHGSLFLSQVIAVRMLGIEEFGEAIIILALPIFVHVFTGMLAGEKTLILFVNHKKTEDVKFGLRYVLREELLQEVLCIPLVCLALWLYNEFLGELKAIQLLLASVCCIAVYGYQVAINYLLNLANYRYLSALYCAEVLLNTLLVYVVLSLVNDSTGYMCAFLIKGWILSVIALGMLFRKTNFLKLQSVVDRRLDIRLAHQKRSLIIKTAWANLDVLLVGLVSGSQSSGEFRIIKSLATIAPLFAQPSWLYFRKSMLSYVRDLEMELLRKLITRVACLLGFFFTVVFAVLFPFMDVVISSIYSLEVSETFMLILAIYVLAHIVANVLTAWSRSLSVMRDEVYMSLKTNIYMLIALIFSPLFYFALGVPIPITMAIATLVVCFIWWRWLYRMS